ncbi:hypothetical protein [Facklamia sp. P12932]|uniref:hypothetical protein n=1 Tax=Facklamia sp. P12932 TaxID=3421947 RepID=UPI003D184E4C
MNKERLEQITFGILQVIKINANIEILINDEFSYLDLKRAIDDLKRNHLLIDYLGELELTNYGNEELKRLKKTINIGSMIIPDFRYFIDKRGINDVYLP